MSGGDYNQQPNQYPQQGGYPPQGYPPQGYQPYGQAYQQQQPYPGGYMPPPAMPTECFGGFWIRLVAYILDALILAIPSAVLSAGIMFAFGFSPFLQYNLSAQAQVAQDGMYQVASNLASLAQILIAWLYYALMTTRKGGTLGKLALGLRVVDTNGMYLGFGRATGRYFAKILSFCMCLIGFIWAGFHPQKRAIHDLIATTWVVRKEYMNPAQVAAEQQPY